MSERYLSAYIQSQKSLLEIKNDAMHIFKSVGGMKMDTPLGFQIINGKFGVQMGFVANLTAVISIHQIKENNYEIQLFLSWNWASFMWVMLVLGFLSGGTLWLGLLLYLFFDPSQTYNQMLYRLLNFEKI
jgi:hypothetical protein